MLIKKQQQPTENDVTDKQVYLDRRKFITGFGALLGMSTVDRLALASECDISPAFATDKPNSIQQITGYNNYYEFSTSKEAIRILAQELTIEPWTITIEGEVENSITIDMDQLQKRFSAEERIYRLRCVEGWSMVIPWNGIPLCKILDQARPTSRAKYVQFLSLHRSKEMIGQRTSTFQWPYREGLRIDEAMHPLTLLATGLYGDTLPKQNGAPLRLVVPWKYGFKSAKAITHIKLTSDQPQSSWNMIAPNEYGFYANVNPNVSHPRWSQRRENRIGELKKRHTDMFNGYADQVASLYNGMDLEKDY
jgi:sulfoxide reductase catalytic subunit YedY